jgi:hypothetical protein
MTNEVLTLQEIARMAQVSVQAVRMGIINKRFPAHKVARRWWVYKQDYIDYVKSKYSREFSKDENGSLIYNPDEGRYSPNQLAKLLGEPVQHIYFLINSNRLRSTRKGKCSHVVSMEDLQSYMKNAIKKRYSKEF